MHQLLSRNWDIDQCVPCRCQLTKTNTQHDQQISSLYRVGQHRICAQAQFADVMIMIIVDTILKTKPGHKTQIPVF